MKVSASRLFVIAGAPLFCVLAMANSAGYRYGVSDLAFYLPAAFRDLDPQLFPRDGALLDVQARFTLADEFIAGLLRTGRLVGLTDTMTIYAAHVGSLLLLFVALIALGAAVFRSSWSIAAFVAAITLRHAVARSGVNTLEGYFHPRMVAFSLCVLALAAFIRRGPWPAVLIGLVACAIHTTTGFWLLICVSSASLVSDRGSRPAMLALGVTAALILAYAITLGPLAGRLHPMDAAWLQVVAEKDYLFPDQWPADSWLICAIYVALIAGAGATRHRRGTLTMRERGLVAGAAALLFVFVSALPLLMMRSALAIQLQPARVFWLLDLIATVSLIWIVESRVTRDRRPTRFRGAPAVLAIVLLAASVVRGVYLLKVRFPERSIFPRSAAAPWDDVMRWAQRSDPHAQWIAHPNHAFMYGSSVRVSGRRDVFVEATKDPALAMYDRDVAMRIAERLPLVSDFDALTAEDVRWLARHYELDYMVTESSLDLPVAYRKPPLIVYRLQHGSDAAFSRPLSGPRF